MNKKTAPFLITTLTLALAACGGGGGGGSDSRQDGSPGAAVSQQGMPPLAAEEAASAEIVCMGNRCQLPKEAIAAPGGSIYRFLNASNDEQELVVSGLASGMWQAAFTQVAGAGVPNDGMALRIESSREERTETDHAADYAAAVEARSKLITRAPQQRMKLAQRLGMPSAYDLGDTREWYDSKAERDVPARLHAKRPLPGGAQVYVWMAGEVAVSADLAQGQTAFLAERFANSVYPLEVSLLGQPWGETNSKIAAYYIPVDTQDVHIVVLPLPARTLGYVWTGNFFLDSCLAGKNKSDCSKTDRSNEALTVFLSSDMLGRVAAGEAWHDRSPGASLAISTLGHEFSHLIFNYHRYFKGEAAVKTETWESELFAQTMGYLAAADTFRGGRGAGADAHPDLRPGGDFEQALGWVACSFSGWKDRSCYPKAMALGAMMLHTHGPAFLQTWMTSPVAGAPALSAGLRAAGGQGYIDVLERYTGTMLSAGSAAVPARYGYAARQISLPPSTYLPHGKNIALPAISIAGDRSLFPTTPNFEISKQYSHVRNGVLTLRVPANSWLSLRKG